ncbi:DUF5822 domain-containing protein [Halobaculum magnesiiphilum]|uniref:DUF5822 domain-containing protein n=1 Tax=Halobaculum magnesiiphilum TaxID=1017351 RepID=A0A8T8WDE2_9EURY|nr:DUF5822 domain-containing protein [Halobaculum magnesiiphilum]QZY02873.1 DUF5822 domain-containing protein [Halobaculum roseum]
MPGVSTADRINRCDPGDRRRPRASVGTPRVATTDRHGLPGRLEPRTVPERVESTDPDGVDYGWVMQMTFVVTVTAGAVLVAALSAFVTLPTWGARASFAIRVGAVIWIVTALAAYYYERNVRAE